MRLKTVFIILPLLVLSALALLGYTSDTPNSHFEERIMVALRSSGNQLLLANQDSTSLVLPVKKLSDKHYELQFASDLWIEPSQLVSIVEANFKAAKLPSDYIVEVIDCNSSEVTYSYLYSEHESDALISCAGREQPLGCYKVNVIFTNSSNEIIPYRNYPIYSLLLVGFIGVGFVYQVKNKTRPSTIDDKNQNYTHIGNFKFYPEQHHLVYKGKIMALTMKECELLQIFSEQQNTVVKREYLVKTVWEDQGVFVGRSLDTYISKLRKKFSHDDAVTLINVHGVGYTLEVKSRD